MVVFVVKYGALYGGIPDSEQLGTNTIWGYPEYGASNCVHHMVSAGLDGLKFKDDSKFACKEVFITAVSFSMNCPGEGSAPSWRFTHCFRVNQNYLSSYGRLNLLIRY